VTADRFRALVATILVVGVGTSAALIAFGFATSLLVGWEGSLAGAPPASGSVTDFATMGESLRALRPVGFAQLGLVVLIGTPVVRVAASSVAFLAERDRLYAGITLVVLLILLASLFGLH
jgi:uncharacterized membrane protein